MTIRSISIADAASTGSHGVTLRSRRLALLGTALGSTLVVGVSPAQAQNVSSTNNTTDYSLVETGTRSGGPRTIDVATSGGNILIDVGTVTVDNTAANNPNNVPGVAIGANNTGPGNVTIRDVNITGTGANPTTGIDARATTGTISITNTGTITTSGNNGDRAIVARSGGGDVNITSNIASGQQYGIIVTGNGGTFGDTGTTTINSTSATANGTGLVNAIVAQGFRVVVNSGTATNANAAGVQGTGIFANAGTGGVLLNAGTTNAFGQNQAAIQVFSDGAVDVTSGTIRTTQNSDGLSIASGSDVVVRSTAITTEGTGGARGIVLGGNSGGGGFNSGPNGFAYNSAVVTSGSISTVGNGAYGIYVTPTGTGTTTINTAALKTTGDNATGVLVTRIGSGSIGGATTISNTGALQTGGANASGIQVNAGTGSVTVNNSGSITTAGSGAYGINIVPTSGATTLTGTGSIATSGANAHGIFLNAAAGANTGAISIASGPIATSGAGAQGIWVINAGGPVSINASDVRTTGTGTAIIVQQTAGSTAPINVQAGIVRSASTGAAINLSSNGTTGAITAAVADSVSVGSAIDARSVGAVSLTAGTVQTTGANATGLVAISTGGTATVNSTSLTSANRGIYAQGLDNVTVNSGTLVSNNADFGLIARTSAASNNDPVVGTAEGVVNVTSTALTATNIGINAFGPRATINVNSGAVTTTAGSAIQAFGIDVNVTSGTITTGGIGIEAGMATGATRRGATVVNSNAITLNGIAGTTVGGINANGATVNVTSGTIIASGPGNRFGISAQVPTSTTAGSPAPGALTVASGSITTVGDGAYGVQAITDSGALTVTSTGTITTTGTTRTAGNQPRYSAGVIAVSGSGAITVASNNISTQGAQSDGIRVEAGSGIASYTVPANLAPAPISVTTSGLTQTAGANADGVNVLGGGGAVTVANSGTITTAGTSSHGIFVNPRAGITAVGNTGAISTSGSGANGIFVTNATGGATIASTGSVATTGAGAAGINVTGTTAALSVSSNSVTTSGGLNGNVAATGINVASTTGAITVTSNIVSVAADSTSAITARASGGGNVSVTATTTTAAGVGVAGVANAITAQSSGTGTTGTVNVVSGTATANGGAAIAALAGGDVTVTSGIATGASIAIQASSQLGNATVDATTTTLLQPPAPFSSIGAISINATAGNAVLRAGTVTTTNGRGIIATAGGTNAVTAGTVSVTGDGNYGVSATGGTGVALNLGQVSTTGALTSTTVNNTTTVRRADAVIAQTSNGAITATIGTATATGANADAVRLTAGGTNGDVTLGVTTAATAAAGNGIVVNAAGAANVTAALATGGGDGAAGVSVTGGTGVTLSVSNAASTGTATTTRADAVFATATTGAINATLGSASATGAGADAVRLIANGTGGAVTATVSGALSSTSGTGLFIDPPGAVTVTVAAGASVAGGLNGINTTGASNAIVNRGSITSTGGAGVLASGATTLTNSGTIAGANNVAVQLGATNDTVTLLSGSAVTGRIVGGGGTDAAILSGTGTVSTPNQTVAGFTGFDTLTVQNGYWTALAGNGSAFGSSVTTNAGSTLDVANGTAGLAVIAPSYIDNGALVVRSSGTSAGSTFGTATVTGSGTVLFTGAGTATLDGVNTIQSTGTVTIDGGSTVLLTGTQGGSFVTGTTGTLQLGNGGTTGTFTGNLVDNGTLVVNRSDTFTFGGMLTGAGNIVKQGAGQLVFGSGYAFTGVTTIHGGSVRLTTPVATNAEIDLEGNGQLDLSGTTQRIAELAGASAGASLNIAGGSLTDVQNTDTTFAGSIVGNNGSLTKSGTGRLNLTGSNSYTGPTTVNDGTLAVNGSIVSPVTVTSGGTLGGTGSVGTVTIGSGGTYAPGNSIGTQTVNGNVTFAAGSVFAVEANAAGQADRINATGTATLQGGTVAVSPVAGSYGNLTNYTILTAGGGVTGTFAAATSADATLTPFLSYAGNSVTLTLARNNVAFAAMGATPNQVAVGTAITQLGVNSGIYRALLPLTASGTATTLGTLSGELYASLPAALADGSKQVREAVLARATTPGDGVGLWATGTRTLAGSRNQTAIAPVIDNRWTAIGGVDFSLAGLRVGLDGGYIEDETRVRRQGGSAHTDTTLVGGHAGYAMGAVSMVVGGDYAWHDITASRSLGIAGLAGGTAATSKAHTVQGYGEIGYGFHRNDVTILPFARFSYVHIVSDGFTETGGLGALSVARDERNYKFGTVGVRMSGESTVGNGVTFLPRATVSYTRGWDVDGSRTLAFAGTTPQFSVAGTALSRDALDVHAGFDLGFGQRLTLGVGGFGSTSREWSEYGAKASIGLKF